MTHSQEPQEDMLVDRGVDDLLDEGYSPPERQPASHRFGITAEEQRHGETFEQRLLQEEPEPDPYDIPVEDAPRAGRLVAPDEGAHEDTDKDEIATDVGIDGGAASAEEAAMHIIDEP